MLKKISAYSLFGLLFFLPACWEKKETPIVKKDGLVVLSVLDKKEFDDCHIKDSMHIAIDELDSAANMIEKTAEVVVYCSDYSCASSHYARTRLMELGFTNVSVYKGGMAEWFTKGLPSEGPATAEYLKNQNVIAAELSAENNEISIEILAQKMGVVAAV